MLSHARARCAPDSIAGGSDQTGRRRCARTQPGQAAVAVGRVLHGPLQFPGLARFRRRIAQRGKVAGVRTNMVVAASACLITMVGIFVFEATKLGDPSRLPGQIIAGITFLGAGVIWKNGWKTQGITTAAVILFSTVIGILCGFGYLTWAITASLIVVFVLQVSYYIFPSDDSNDRTLSIVCPLDKYDAVRNLFPKGSNIEQFSRRDGSVVEVRINARLTRDDLNKLISTNIHNPDLLSIDLVDEHSS